MAARKSRPLIQGIVDHGDRTMISGWAFDPAHPDDAVELEVLLGDEPISRVMADGYRKDLLDAGYGNGRHAFALPLPSAMFTAPILTLHVRAVATKAALGGSPVTVVNQDTLLDPTTLAAVSKAIAAEVAGACEAGQLQPLATWLLQQFDAVYLRQANLAASNSARLNRFFELVGETGLSDTVRQAAEAVVTRYPALSIPKHDHPLVSVLIPAFNNFGHTYRCVQSIVEHQPEASFELVLIDDGSTDETVFAPMVLSGGIRLVRQGTNQGYFAAITAGVGVAHGQVLHLLNNDTEVHPGWLDELVQTLHDPSIGIAGSKLVFPDGTLQESGGIIWRQATGYNWGRGEDAAHCDYAYMRDADYVSGASLIIRRAAFDRVAGLSQEFAPGYYEDTDLCFKVRQAGYRVVVQPSSVVTHHEGATAGTDLNGSGMKRYQRINQGRFLTKWREVLQGHGTGTADPALELNRSRRSTVLFIDETVPTPDQDAGSNAALQHMKSLQRLGYRVAFVGADNMAKISPYTQELERLGIQCFYAPYYRSVEEILRKAALSFGMFYIHRMNNLVKYEPLIRRHWPAGHVIFNVADLHHLRLAREAELNHDKMAARKADQVREVELDAARRADAVIVHSSYEHGVLSRAGLNRTVHVIPWVVECEPVRRRFDERNGVAFIGGFNHPPNVDAAKWLAQDIMPLVSAAEPDLELTLIGSQLPDAVSSLQSRVIRVIGHVPHLTPVLHKLRLTVAPLRYGAGLKGKVLTSLAAGVPCVMTSVAAEGMDLPPEYAVAIADTPAGIAAAILSLHRNPDLNAVLANAGLAFIQRTYSPERVDGLLASALRFKPMTGVTG